MPVKTMSESAARRRTLARRAAQAPQASDQVLRQMIHDTLAFSARLNGIRNRLGQSIGLSGTAYSILISVRHLQEEDGVGVNQVAEHLHLSGAFVTIEVNKLIEAKLVRKKSNPDDRRRVLLTVTPSALGLLNELAAVEAPANGELFGTLTAEEFDVLRKVMRKLVGSAGKAISLIEHLSAARR